MPAPQQQPQGSQFNLIPLKDIARGIDMRAAESNITDGYCEDLVNVDCNSSGHLAKRHGYQGYAGYVPLRVQSAVHNGYQLELKLQSGINLSKLSSGPVLVYGKLDQAESGDFSTSAALRYYESFSTDVRDSFLTSGSTVTKLAADTGATSSDQLVYVMNSTSESNQSNEWVHYDQATVNTSTLTMTVTDVVNATERAYVLDVDRPATAGLSYIYDGSGGVAPSGGVVTLSIPAATHGLSNFNIVAKAYDLSGSTLTTFTPDVVQINSTTGDVTVSFLSAGTWNGIVVLTHAPSDNYKQLTLSAGASGTIVLSNITTNFPWWGFYWLNGSTWEAAFPDSVVTDATTGTVTVSITNSSVSPETYAFYYDFGNINANTLRLVDTQAYSGTWSNSPNTQLTVWGIKQANLYSTSGGGSVTHIDSYKRNTEARLVCGLGGNLFAARTQAEVGGTYQLPTFTVNLNARIGSTVSLAPLFQPTGTSSSIRTRGIITGDNVSNAYAVVSSVTYVSSGVADYTLSLVNKVGTLTLGTQVSAQDWLTVAGMAHSVANGTFQVQSVSAQTTSTVTLRVSNPAFTLADYNETNSAGQGNVFTDTFTTSAQVNFVNGDSLLNDTVKASGLSPTVKSCVGSNVYVDGIKIQLSLAGGSSIFGTRTSYVLPLKDASSTASVKYLVRGDMLTVSSLVRKPRAVNVNPYHDLPVTLTSGGGTVTVSVGSASTVTNINTGTGVLTAAGHGFSDNDPVYLTTTNTLPAGLRSDCTYFVSYIDASTFKLRSAEGGSTLAMADVGSGTITVQRVHGLVAGQRVTLAQTGDTAADGAQTISTVPTRSTFTYSGSTTATTGTMVGRTVELDEALILGDALSSPVTVSVNERWIPIEAPACSGGLPKQVYTNYFADTTDVLRSCMVSSNMYFLNQTDQVQKFDGTSLYQAGLYRWQPQLFVQVDSSGTALTLDGLSATVSAVTGNKFTLGAGEAGQFHVGNRIVHSQNNAIYTVSQVDTTTSTTNSYVYVAEASITGTASGTLKATKTYHYYFRLNAFDANNNIIASAVTGSLDYVVELAGTGNIRMRLLSPPVFGAYDYDRIECQVYRAVGNTTAPYYLIRSTPVTFSSGFAYIDINDGTIDSVLTQRGSVGDDATMIALKGAELGTGWEQPLRAKHLCATKNRLLLANVKDYQQLDIVVRKQAKAALVQASDLNNVTFLFKKDSTDTGTTTDNVNRQKFQYVTSGAVTIVPANITTTSTTFTVPTASPPAVGSWVYLFQSATGTAKSLQFAGWFQVASVVAATSFTVNFANSYTASSADVDRFVTASTATDIPVWLGTDGNYSGMKYGNTTDTYEFFAGLRLANAINAAQVATDRTIAGQSSFTPWMVANAGSEYKPGELVVRVPKYVSTSLQVTLGTLGSNYDIYVNNTKQVTAASVSATSLLFPSRVLVSYANYPELFDSPTADPTQSDSVVDVNSADGQEITGIIPFYGSSAFSASQVEDVVVVFKTNSVYVLNVGTRDIQKIDSQGQGCTAPYTIASTRNGIMFANLSGVYRLNRDLTVTYVGKNLERYWRDTVNASSLSVATGHNYGVGRQYKLSVPVGSDSTNSVVLVYDHTREGVAVGGYTFGAEYLGAWSRYTNFKTTGWCTLNNISFFATSDGQVFSVRSANDPTDYRDDAGPVDTMVILIRASDCGMPGVRKNARAVVTHIRVEKTAVTGTVMAAAVENSYTFQTIGTIVKSFGDKKVSTFRSNLPTPRFTYLTLSYTNAVKDENFVLAGVDLVVSQLSTHGLVERSKLS